MAMLRQWSPEVLKDRSKRTNLAPEGGEMPVPMLEECCVSLCSAIASKIQENVLSVLSPAANSSQLSTQFSTKSTVGLMLNGTMIDNMVIGGPAYNSGQLEQGDVIVQIDQKPVTVEELHDALLGSDIPGSTVVITVRSKGSTGDTQQKVPEKRNPLWFAAHGPVAIPAVLRDQEPEKPAVMKTVVLTRMATEIIADRRRMFELFTIMKVQAQVKNDGSAVSTVDECIQLWSKMLLADSIHSEKVSDNVKNMQRECTSMLEILMYYIESLAHAKAELDDKKITDRRSSLEETASPAIRSIDRLRERAAPPESSDVLLAQQENEAVRMKQLMEKMNTSLEGMIPKEQHEAELARIQKQMNNMVPKAQYDAAQDEIERCEFEIQRWKKSVEGMVFKAQYETVQDEVRLLNTEISRLQKLVDNSVPKTQYIAAQEEIKRSCSILERSEQEIQRLKRGMEASTPRVQLETAHDELNRYSQEIKLLQERILSMVPKTEFSNLQNELDVLIAENSRLQKLVDTMITKTQFDLAQDEIERGALENRRLKRIIEDMIPKEQLRIAQDEVARCTTEIDLLQERIKSMITKEQFGRAEVEIQGLNAKVARMQNLIDDMIPRSQYDAAVDKGLRAEKEIERMQKTVENISTETQSDVEALKNELAKLQKINDGMITKAQYEAAKDETQLLQFEMDRLKRCIESMVPKGQLDTAMDEVSRCLDEIQRLQERMKTMIPKDELLRSGSENQRLEADLNRMKQYLDSMVPQPQYEALQERMEAHNRSHQAEIEGMKKLLDTMVSRAEAEADMLRLQKIIDSKVPKAKYDALQDENQGCKLQIDRLQASIQGMVPKTIYESLHDEVSRNSRDVERLQKALADSAPKADLAQCKEEVKRLTSDNEGLKVSLAARTDQVSGLQSEIKSMKENLDRTNDILSDSVPRKEVSEAKAEAKAIRIEADTYKQEVAALENQVASLAKLLEGRVSKDELVQAQKDANRAREELSDVRHRLADAGLSDSAVLNRLLIALKGSPPIDPSLAARLLEKIKGASLQVLIDELCQLLDLIADPGSGAIHLGDLNLLVNDLRDPPFRSLQEMRAMLKICNQQTPISALELKKIRTLMTGPPGIKIDQLEQLLVECNSAETVQNLRSELQAAERRRSELVSMLSSAEGKILELEDHHTELQRQQMILTSVNSNLKDEISLLKIPKAPVFTQPCKKTFTGTIVFQLVSTNEDATIYYTVDSTEPAPNNFFGCGISPLEVLISQTAVIKAVCVTAGQDVSPVSSFEVLSDKDRMEKARQERASLEKERAVKDRPMRERSIDSAASSASTASFGGQSGGLGMLIQRFHDDGHVEIKSLIDGGPASRDGRISPGDRLLAVDQHDTTSLSKGEVLQLISGPVGTQVELKLMRTTPNLPPEVFWVTLVRSAASAYSTDSRAGAQVRTPQGAQNKDPSLAFILGRHI